MSLEIWDKMSRPPKEALKQIRAGRLQGMSDINPQWRYKIMTETFGPCGIGWAYEVTRLWMEPAFDGQVMAFAEIKLMIWIKERDQWSHPIPGIGGSMFIAKESRGLHASDECFKMAVTDALSVAMKVLGVGADIYAGMWDGSKYKDEPSDTKKAEFISDNQLADLNTEIKDRGVDLAKFLKFAGVESLDKITTDKYPSIIKAVQSKEKA